MKLKRILLLVLIFISILVTKCQATINIVALGDSITYGYGVNKDERYVTLVQNYFIQKGEDVNLKDYSLNGQTSVELLQDLKNNSEELEDIKNADYILMSMGGNDYLHVITKLLTGKFSITSTTDKLIENMEKIFKILDDNSDGLILVVPQYNPFLKLMQEYQDTINEFKDAQNRFEKLDDNYSNIIVINEIQNELEQPENLSSSDYDPHPSNIGHKLIGEKMIEKVEKYKISKKIVKNAKNSNWLKILGFVIIIIAAMIVGFKKSKKN